MASGERVLAIVDEAHLNAVPKAQEILARHLADGGAYVGFTATPIGLAHAYDTLVVAGTPSELRECGALVRASHYGPDEPDMKGFKQDAQTGEFAKGDVRSAVMTKTIFGRVPGPLPPIEPGPAADHSGRPIRYIRRARTERSRGSTATGANSD